MTDNNTYTSMPDYESYSLEELAQALNSIDAVEYPERAAKISALIVERKNKFHTSHEAISNANDKITRIEQIKFHGKAREFFSIWIVNLLLSIVTLGIYSAWATVRTKRYFYSNTELEGHRFSYLAEPLQILKGRIIAVILFGSYFFLTTINAVAALIFALVLMALTPTLIILSMRFRLRMTAYRNVRFSFKGRWGEAFTLFVLLPIASVFTLHLLMPWVLKKIDAFLVNESCFGNKSFSTTLDTGKYYRTSIGVLFISLCLMLSSSFVLGLGAVAMSNGEPSSVSALATIPLVLFYLVTYAVVSGYYNARIRNHIFQNTQLENVAQFNSSLAAGALIKLRLVNALAIVLTLGMAIPWAKVRSAKLFADATEVKVLDGFDQVLVGSSGSAGAVAEEAATLFDVDVALG